MPRCIYCKIDKELDSFNKEHVLHDSFGSFKNNLTLVNKVCLKCNSLFGNTIDTVLARDSIEGFKRVQYGFKKKEDFRTKGKNSKIKIRVSEGLLAGLLACLSFDQNQKKNFTKTASSNRLEERVWYVRFFYF